MVVADDLLAEFLNEAASHLDAADGELARLAQDAPAAILGILRRIHTIRGTAGFLNLPHLEQLRTVEIVLDDLRSRTRLPGDVDRRVRGALAIARSIVASVERSSVQPVAAVAAGGAEKPPGHEGPMLLVSSAVIERLSGLADALLSPAAEDPEARRDLVRRLGQDMEAARRQPLRHAWSKLGRLVEEIATTAGKRVAFRASGGETAMDYRAVLLVRDALTHVVRNAAHHGIEDPMERVARGKSPVGSISVTATTDLEHVTIEVVDDGSGLDFGALRRRSVALGLMSRSRADALSDCELADIVFTPGFSTSHSVGSLSGLGMGLDIVRANIAELGGQVAVRAAAGTGLSITISVPIQPAASAGMPRIDPGAEPRPILVAARRGAGRDTLQHLLSALGLPVETAGNAGEALDAALDRAFAAIVVDQDLSDRPGIDLARAVRRHPPIAGTPIVLLLPSGSRLPDSDRRSLDLVAIPHPFGRASLRGPAISRHAA